MDDSWVVLANWMTAGAVVVSLLAVFLSRPVRERGPGAVPVVHSNQGPQLLEGKALHRLLDNGREYVLRLRDPSEVETLELYDEDGHRKRYEGLYVLYIAPADTPTAPPQTSAE